MVNSQRATASCTHKTWVWRCLTRPTPRLEAIAANGHCAQVQSSRCTLGQRVEIRFAWACCYHVLGCCRRGKEMPTEHHARRRIRPGLRTSCPVAVWEDVHDWLFSLSVVHDQASRASLQESHQTFEGLHVLGVRCCIRLASSFTANCRSHLSCLRELARIVHDRQQARSSASSSLPSSSSSVVREPRVLTALLSLLSPICDTRISSCRGSASSSYRSPPSAQVGCFLHVAHFNTGPHYSCRLDHKCFPNSSRNALHSDLRPLKRDHPHKTCCVHLRERHSSRHVTCAFLYPAQMLNYPTPSDQTLLTHLSDRTLLSTTYKLCGQWSRTQLSQAVNGDVLWKCPAVSAHHRLLRPVTLAPSSSNPVAI